MQRYDLYELQHHGVKGMKWGIRRFQKKDGSLTSAGKKRYNDDMSDDAREASALKKKKVSQMSNAELRQMNERQRLEQEYSRLNPGAFKKGLAFTAAAAGVMGTALSVYNNSSQIVKIGKTVGNKLVDVAGNMVMADLRRRMT